RSESKRLSQRWQCVSIIGRDAVLERSDRSSGAASLDSREQALDLAQLAARHLLAEAWRGVGAARLAGLAGQIEQRPELLALGRDNGPAPDRDQPQRLEQRGEGG